MRAFRLLPFGLFVWCAVLGAQIDPHAALTERAAWTALNAGRAHAAAEAFREALTADPKNPRLHLGAGVAAALERRDADARDEFARALALDPRLVQARALLGQMQYRTQRLLAVRTYETLVVMAPDDRQARATLERWQREADAGLAERRARDGVGDREP
jgi:cytochrome c-type biogenesis protein CcmH/NrfG